MECVVLENMENAKEAIRTFLDDKEPILMVCEIHQMDLV